MDAFSSPAAAAFSNFWAPVLRSEDSPTTHYDGHSESNSTTATASFFVSPALPTAAGSTKSYELIGNDLALLYSVNAIALSSDVNCMGAERVTVSLLGPKCDGYTRNDRFGTVQGCAGTGGVSFPRSCWPTTL